MSGQLHAPVISSLVFTGQERLGGPYSWSGHYGEDRNLLPLLGIEPRFLCCKTLAQNLTEIYLVVSEIKTQIDINACF